MKLVVFSHKACWPCAGSSTGYATDGGFPFQMKAISELFDETALLVPCCPRSNGTGEISLQGHNLRIAPLSPRHGAGFYSKLNFLPWLLRNSGTMLRELRRADGVHAPIPGDVGTVGMLGAWLCHKPLFVRYCGNWLTLKTTADRFWHWFMERFAGGRNVMLATGGMADPPSTKTDLVRWIFATSLAQAEIDELADQEIVPDPGKLSLIIVGRQDGGKGTEVLIRTLPRLHPRYPSAILHVVGDGSAVPALKKLAADLGMREQVVFHGKVNHEEVLCLLRQAHFFCFPTESEGFPKSVLEAMACGLPVIATPVSAIPSLLAGGGGILTRPDPEAFAVAISELVASPARYRTMSAKARKTAAGTPSNAGATLLEDILKRRGGRYGKRKIED